MSLPLWTVWIAFGFSYYGVVLYITRIFDHTNDSDDGDDDDVSCDFDYQDIFFSALSELIGVLVASFIIDRHGRVPTQTWLYATSGFGALMMGVSSAAGMDDYVVSVFGVLSRCGVMGASCATWVSTPELFPTHLRATGHSISSSVSRLGAFTAPFIVNNHALSIFAVGIVLSVVNVAAAIAANLLPETMGKDLDEVSKEESVDEGEEVKNVLQEEK